VLIERAYNLLADYALVAGIAAKEGDKGLEAVGLEIGSPAKVMLYQKAADIADGFEQVGKPCKLEFKYDGLRMQVHKKGDSISVYTRRLDDVTKMFPEVVAAVKKSVKADCIIEGEGVGFDPKTKMYKPFQEISKRIKRKYDIDELAKETPVVLNLFDILNCEGESYIEKPLKERWEKLKQIVKELPWQIELAKQKVTSSEKEAQ
jgi:DNA ligase-1